VEHEFNALVMLFHDVFVFVVMMTLRGACQSAPIEHMDLELELLL